MLMAPTDPTRQIWFPSACYRRPSLPVALAGGLPSAPAAPAPARARARPPERDKVAGEEELTDWSGDLPRLPVCVLRGWPDRRSSSASFSLLLTPFSHTLSFMTPRKAHTLRSERTVDRRESARPLCVP